MTKTLSKKIKSYSLVDLQKFAARCLESFANQKTITSSHLDRLINHLKSIPSGDSIIAWERQGALLDINGRGDPWPQEFEAIVPKTVSKQLAELIDSAVEVGICDIYGAKTKEPLRFASKCGEILEREKIKIPL